MKKLAIAALSVVTCASMGLFAACNNDDGEKKGSDADISLMNYWRGNEDEETYSIKTETNGDLTIKYEKSGQWQYAIRTFVEESADLALMKTLVLEGSAVTSTNDPRMTLKITYKGDIPDKEVHFDMSESKATYEWDLSNANMSEALSLMLFAEGNRASANGTITVNDMHLTAKAINGANNVEASKPTDEKVVNEITATSATLNGGWYDSGDGVYTVAKDGNNYNVQYNKRSFEYPNVQAIVKGDAIKNYKSLRVTVKGTVGERFRINFFDALANDGNGQNHESDIVTLTGEDDEIVLDLTTFIADMDCSVEQKVFIMAQPGTTDVTGSFVIKGATFSNEEAPKPEVKVVNTITATAATANGGWYDSGDAVYTVSKDGGNYNVAYNKGSFEYPGLYALVTGEAMKTYKTLRVTVKGTAGEVFKTNLFTGGNHESEAFTLTGGDDEIVLDLTPFIADVDCTLQHRIIIMAQPGTTNVTGNFTVKNAVFSMTEAAAEPEKPEDQKVVHTITSTDNKVNNGWYDNNGANVAYTIVKNGTDYNVSYAKGNNEWAGMYATVTGEAIKDYKTLRITIKGTAGEKFRTNFNVANNNHESDTFTLTGGDDVIILDLTKFADLATADYTKEYKVLIMAQPGTKDVNGSFIVKNAEFSMDTAPVAPQKVVNTITATDGTLNGGWYDYGDGFYTIEKGDNGYDVEYSKPNHAYGSMYATVTGEAIKDYKTLRVTIKGTADEKFRINFNVATATVTGGNHESDTFTLTGGEDVIILDLTKFADLATADYTKEYKVLIMAQFGVATASGSFTILNAEFSNEEAPAA